MNGTKINGKSGIWKMLTSVSKLDSQGNQWIWACIKCSLYNDICTGIKICLENNHKKQCWKIIKYASGQYKKTLAKGKDETLSLNEFVKWLNDNGYNNENDNYFACLDKNESER